MVCPWCLPCGSEAPQCLHGVPMVHHGVSMTPPWCLDGVPMVPPWWVQRTMSLATLRCLHGGSNAPYLWRPYGASMVRPKRHGVWMACPCSAHSVSLVGPRRRCNGHAMDTPWTHHGAWDRPWRAKRPLYFRTRRAALSTRQVLALRYFSPRVFIITQLLGTKATKPVLPPPSIRQRPPKLEVASSLALV